MQLQRGAAGNEVRVETAFRFAIDWMGIRAEPLTSGQWKTEGGRQVASTLQTLRLIYFSTKVRPKKKIRLPQYLLALLPSPRHPSLSLSLRCLKATGQHLLEDHLCALAGRSASLSPSYLDTRPAHLIFNSSKKEKKRWQRSSGCPSAAQKEKLWPSIFVEEPNSC